MNHARPRSDRGFWLILLPVAAVIFVPTLCIIWFAGQAIRSEELAVRQRLTDVYRMQLAGVQRRIQAYWNQRLEELNTDPAGTSAAENFARLVLLGWVDSAVILDAGGQVRYPAPIHWRPPASMPREEWSEAVVAEHESNDPLRAARLYADIARAAGSSPERARALVARARCLTKAGEKTAALELLTATVNDPQYGDATDEQGRLVVPNAQLMALRLLDDHSAPMYVDMLNRLVNRLNDYREPIMSAAQRVHLMAEVRSIAPEAPAFPTLQAEHLAAAYLEADSPIPSVEGKLLSTSLPGVWRLLASHRRVIALFREEQLIREMHRLVQAEVESPDVKVSLVPPEADKATAFLSVPATLVLPDWNLILDLRGGMPLASAAERQAAVYLWTGTLAVLTIVLLSLVVIRQVGRQVKLAELRNNLVATVSHELRTPLSSIRLLLEVLAESECRDRDQVKEYLGLITKETARLDRLVEHFLAYWRMEQRRQGFVMSEVEPAGIAQTAVESVQERCAAAGASLTVDVPPALPIIRGDAEALVTVLVNLLDNACKYCENQPRIVLRAYTADGQVCFAVQDNGIGLSRRSIKRIFDRFYQVDQRLSRKTGGCGLGLSIVRFIVDAHGGSVQVASEPGKGSTFTVKLPITVERRLMSDERSPGD